MPRRSTGLAGRSERVVAVGATRIVIFRRDNIDENNCSDEDNENNTSIIIKKIRSSNSNVNHDQINTKHGSLLLPLHWPRRTSGFSRLRSPSTPRRAEHTSKRAKQQKKKKKQRARAHKKAHARYRMTAKASSK